MEFKDYLGILKRQIVIVLVVAVTVFFAWFGAVHVPQPEEYVAKAKVFSPNFSADFRIYSQFTGNTNLSPYISQTSRMYLAYTEGVVKMTLLLIRNWDKIEQFVGGLENESFVRYAKQGGYVRQFSECAIEDIQDKYSVSPIDNTPQMFIISAKSTDPEMAKTLANLVGFSLCLHVKTIYSNGLLNAIAVMDDKCRDIRGKLGAEEKILTDMGFNPDNTDVVDTLNRLKTDHANRAASIESLRSEIAGIASRIEETDKRIERLKAGEEKVEAIVPPTPAYVDLVSKIVHLENQMFEMRLNYTDDHPLILAAKKKVKYYHDRLKEEETQMLNGLTKDAIEKKIRQMIEQLEQVRILRNEEMLAKKEAEKHLLRTLEDLAKRIEDQRLAADAYWKKKDEYQTQQRNIGTVRAELTKNETYLDHLQQEKALLPEMLRVEEPAKDTAREGKSTERQLPIMIVLAIIIGISAGYLRDYLDDRVRTPYDLRRYMNIPTIGVVPETGSRESLIMETALKSPLSETYAHIAAVLNTMIQQEQAKVFLITSTTAQEGKTTISSNTATAFARMGKKVCLIDCDMRRPSVHKIFHVDNSIGVSSFLSGKIDAKVHLNHIENQPIVIPEPEGDMEAPRESDISTTIEAKNPIDEVLVETETDNLWVIPCGPSPVNPVSLLESAAMKELLRLLKERFDVIIVDSPPIDSTADPLILTSSTDKTILVISCWATRKYQLAWCKRMLGNVKVNLAGAILNRSTVVSKGYYYYYYDSTSTYTDRT